MTRIKNTLSEETTNTTFDTESFTSYKTVCQQKPVLEYKIVNIDSELVINQDIDDFKEQYVFALPEYADIFSQIKNKIDEIKHPTVKKQANEFIARFFYLINKYYSSGIFYRNIRKLSFNEIDDGAGLFEWNFYAFHIGFSFEVDRAKSNYYFIFDDEKQSLYVCISSLLKQENYEEVINFMINFVLQYT